MLSFNKPLSSRGLTASYLACLFVIAGVAGTLHVAFVQHYQRDHALAAIINMSGRQRMLSQRIASLAAEYRSGDQSARAPLLAAADELQTHQDLLLAMNQNEMLSDSDSRQVRQVYCGHGCGLDQAVSNFAAGARLVASLPPGAPGASAAYAAIVTQARASLIGPLNYVVQLQQHRTEQALNRLYDLERAALLVILLTLIAEATFIFRPMINSMARRLAEARALARALAKEHELLLITLNSIGDGVITTDARGNVTLLNPIAENLTGCLTGNAIGLPIEEVFAIFHEETQKPAENPIRIALVEGRIAGLAARTKLRSRHGDEVSVEDSAAPMRDELGGIIGAVLVFRDVTQQRKLVGEMTYRATHDKLTGLLNRSEFEHRMEYLLHKAHADGTANAMMFIDLDQFKLVNDTCGHATGDQLLVQVGKILTSLVRGSDTVARLGGDEFAVLLDRCPIDNARTLAQKICEKMEEYRFSHNGQRFRVGASIGLVPIDRRWSDTTVLMHAADACCYAAKLAGRNRVHGWSDTDKDIRARHGEARWAARLEQALDDDRFVLFAQRIHHFAGDDGIHAEILLRMRDTDGALLPPGAFLPAAERFHMASRLDRWVVSKALDWMRQQPDLDSLALIAVNLSGQSVSDAAFQRWVLAELSDSGSRVTSRLCIEITETSAVTNLADASQFIQQLQAIGVRVALDDFGAGASSFGYLKSMAVDFLKIDGQFVRDILTDKLDAAAVRCFVEVAAVAGMQTIAEFTETAEVMDQLRAMGVDYAQGYHIHKPSPIDELMTLVRQTGLFAGE